MTVTLTLTDEQAEILGYALTVAKRDQERAARESSFRGGGWTKENAKRHQDRINGCLDRARRIEEVRELLDCAPSIAA